MGTMKFSCRPICLLILLLALSDSTGVWASIPNDNWAHEDTDEDNFHLLTRRKFQALGYLPQGDVGKLKPAWPLQDHEASLLTRFGTTTTLPNFSMAYNHEALDITRSSITVSDTVYAPADGLAIVLQDNLDDPYATAVAILDEESQLVISLLHLHPAAHLRSDQLIRVRRGEVIGQLAPVNDMVLPADRESYKHVHLSVLDLAKGALLNPTAAFLHYQDQVRPFITGLKIFDGQGLEQPGLVNGRIDLTVEAADLDNQGIRNFEIRTIALRVSDQTGRVLFDLKACPMDFLTLPIMAPDLRAAYHLDFIASFWDNAFPFPTNAAVSHRMFSYVATNFQQTSAGCALLPDSEGFIEVDERVQELSVQVDVSDHHGNSAHETFTLRR